MLQGDNDTGFKMSKNLTTLEPGFSHSMTSHRTRIASTSATYLEDASDDLGSCNSLLRALLAAKVSGPLFFRLHSEFEILERAGQSDVLKAKEETVKKIQRARSAESLTWSIESFVIKRHRPRTDRDSSTQLATNFMAARREVLALSHRLFRNHPNIVQLRAWGFCLDTVEEPNPQSVQVPLLVLERAVADLEAFLQPSPKDSLPTSPKLRIELCRDIGAGLEILHNEGFTHGDLKPKNILVFKKGHDEWIAKLCDFGCAQGFTADPATQRDQGSDTGTLLIRAANYYGTRNWRPPEVARTDRSGKRFSHEALQRCDIFVYGLVVWSVLGNDGKSCDFNEFADPMKTQSQAIQAVNKALRVEVDILPMAKKVFRDCLCEADQRSLKPWTRLRHRSLSSAVSGKIRQMVTSLTQQNIPSIARPIRRFTTTLDFSWSKKSHIPSSSTYSCRPLSPIDKSEYQTQEWWDQQRTPTSRTILLSAAPRPPEDGDPHRVSTFQEPRGEQEVRKVYNDIKSSLGRTTPAQAIRLYCCARFRSRISLNQWTSVNIKENLVELALTSVPTPEISTLAWLCRGEVGSHEVKTLPHTFRTWNLILDPKYLNESERLERFLLLLQSGADIQKELPISPIWIDEKRSLLFEYIRSCRRAVVRMIMREILDPRRHTSEQTKTYLMGPQLPFRSTALGQFVDAVNYEAVYELHPKFNQATGASIQKSDLFEPLSVMQNPEDYRLEYRRDAQQIVNLLLEPKLRNFSQEWDLTPARSRPEDAESGLQRRVAPNNTSPVPGWEMIKVSSGDDEIELYQDLVTRSITFQKPCFNLAEFEIQIGYQDQPGRSLYLPDISLFFQSTSNPEASSKRPRFPVYSDEWFKGEQDFAVSTEDILGTLRDPWRVPSLTEAVDITWLSYFLEMWKRVLSISWTTLVLYGLRILPLAGLLVHKAK